MKYNKLNHMLTIILSILLFGTMSFAKDYVIDTAHSQIEFKVKHLSISNVKGRFNEFNGVLSVDKNKLTSFMGEVSIDSIDTNNTKRDGHIKDKDYFDAKKFPKATMNLVKMDGNSGIFDLTIKGITKQVKFDVDIFGTSKNQAGKEMLGMELSGTINRKDFGVGASTLNTVISDNVNIVVSIEGSIK